MKCAQSSQQVCCACRAMIARNEGCNHMTCRCGQNFCYACGSAYIGTKKGCQCSLFGPPAEPWQFPRDRAAGCDTKFSLFDEGTSFLRKVTLSSNTTTRVSKSRLSVVSTAWALYPCA